MRKKQENFRVLLLFFFCCDMMVTEKDGVFMKKFDYDIVIIGAGPAGANLARLLKKDKRILLIDGAGEKEKVCGE